MDCIGSYDLSRQPNFFFNDTATTEIYTLSLHDALPIFARPRPLAALRRRHGEAVEPGAHRHLDLGLALHRPAHRAVRRSEEHTSELQSRQYLVCRLLLEKKKISYTSIRVIAYTRPDTYL